MFDFVVVGAGIAARTLATRLAQAGCAVLALEPAEEPDARSEPQPGVGGMAEGMLLCPSNRVWDELQELTGDAEWSAEKARQRYERIEFIENRPVARMLQRYCGYNPARRGFEGWLPTRALGSGLGAVGERYFGPADPNDWSHVEETREAVWCRPPSHDVDVAEVVRLRLLDTARADGSRLTLRRGVRITRLLCDRPAEPGADLAITGVQYLEPAVGGGPNRLRRAGAVREVILCGGTFAVPKLLLFSGIGPAAVLARHGIPLLLDRPGVGAGFSACAEISVEADAPGDFASFPQARFDATMLVTLHSSRADEGAPDVILYRRFVGGRSPEEMTWRWIIRALPSPLPGNRWRRVPEGLGASRTVPHCPATETEADALLEAVKFLRCILDGAGVPDTAARIVAPTEVIELAEDDVALSSFIRRHARCTAPVGTCPVGREDDDRAVLDSRLRVIGTTNLRVVDEASFPSSPGFFPDVPLLIAAELAAEDLLRTAAADDGVPPLDRGLVLPNPLRQWAMRVGAASKAAAGIAALLSFGRRFLTVR